MRLTFCVACGNTNPEHLEHHHLLPRSEGGPDVETNLITLCAACHGVVHGVIRRPMKDLIRRRTTAVSANRVMSGGTGKLDLPPRRAKPRFNQKRKIAERIAVMRPLLAELAADGIVTLSGIAKELNLRGIKGPNGGLWWAGSVKLLRRAIEGSDLSDTPKGAFPGGATKSCQGQKASRARASHYQS